MKTIIKWETEGARWSIQRWSEGGLLLERAVDGRQDLFWFTEEELAYLTTALNTAQEDIGASFD